MDAAGRAIAGDVPRSFRRGRGITGESAHAHELEEVSFAEEAEEADGSRYRLSDAEAEGRVDFEKLVKPERESVQR